MGGRLKIVLLLMVTVFHPDSALAAQPPNINLHDEATQRIAERCRATAGEQAAQDVINVPQNWMVCTRFQEWYGEVNQDIAAGDVKAAIGRICQKKVELLRCSRQSFETLKRCLDEKEKQGIDTVQNQALPAAADFICRHDDEIADIFASPEEKECVPSLGDKMNTCFVEVSGGPSQSDPNPQRTEKACEMAGALKKCINGIPGRCADSSFLDLLNSLFEEELQPRLCSQKHYVASTAGPLPQAATLLNQLSGIILTLAVPYILHL